jgi:hypothetical protein
MKGEGMIEVFQAPDHVLALGLRGEISNQDIAAVREACERKLAAHPGIGIVVDLTSFSDATEQAIREDVRFELGMVGQLHRFPRLAIVTDKQWIGVLMRFVGQFMPQIETEIFAPAKRADAIAWSAALPATRTQSEGRAMKRIPTDRDDVYAFELDGVVSVAEAPLIADDFNRIFGAHPRVRMLARIKRYGFDPAILMQKALMSAKVAAIQKVERYAVVGAPEWMRKVIEAMSPMFPAIEMRTFGEAQEGEAWAWIGATPRE